MFKILKQIYAMAVPETILQNKAIVNTGSNFMQWCSILPD